MVPMKSKNFGHYTVAAQNAFFDALRLFGIILALTDPCEPNFCTNNVLLCTNLSLQLENARSQKIPFLVS